MTARERLYAARIARRAIGIMAVPKDSRAGVLEALSATDRARCERAIEEATTVKGHITKAELLERAASIGIEVPEGATNPEIASLIRNA